MLNTFKFRRQFDTGHRLARDHQDGVVTGHGADHVLPGLVAPSVTVPVQAGEPLLGTWQSVVLVDLNRDNPRRTVRLSFISW